MATDVRILLGSDSDWETIEPACRQLEKFDVEYEVRVISAHRSPERLAEYVRQAEREGAKIFIAAAGGAAHLPGVVASLTNVPVIGVPVATSLAGGLDSLLSICQMPGGVPVATMAVGRAGATNAAIFAIRCLALSNPELAARLATYREEMQKQVASKDQRVQELVRGKA